MDLDLPTAREVLNSAIAGGDKKQLYGYHEGKVYEFQPDNAGTYHGYPIRGDEAPKDVLRKWLAEHVITDAQYNRLRKGK